MHMKICVCSTLAKPTSPTHIRRTTHENTHVQHTSRQRIERPKKVRDEPNPVTYMQTTPTPSPHTQHIYIHTHKTQDTWMPSVDNWERSFFGQPTFPTHPSVLSLYIRVQAQTQMTTTWLKFRKIDTIGLEKYRTKWLVHVYREVALLRRFTIKCVSL